MREERKLNDYGQPYSTGGGKKPCISSKGIEIINRLLQFPMHE
jgi:hypothetical protein